MNTDALAKHYDKLTPRERLPLIMAASARDDEVERGRLVRSAPRVHYSVPNYFGLAQAFNELSLLHLMELLNLAALYFRTFGLADSDDDKVSERMLDCALLYGYLFKVQLAGWRLFCADFGVDPEFCWTPLPGFETVQKAERMADAASFVREGVVAYAKRSGRDDLKPPTAEGIAAGLRVALEERAEWWG
jgi:hypothetical protein